MNRFVLSALLALALVGTSTSDPLVDLGSVLNIAGGVTSTVSGDTGGNLLGGLGGGLLGGLLGEDGLLGGLLGDDGLLGGLLGGDLLGGGVAGLRQGGVGAGLNLSGLLGSVLGGLDLGSVLGGLDLGSLVAGGVDLNILNGLLGGLNLGGLTGGVTGVADGAKQTGIAVNSAFSHFEIFCKLIQKYLALFECYMNNWERMLNDTSDFNKLLTKTAEAFGIKNIAAQGIEGVKKLITDFLTLVKKDSDLLFLGANSFVSQFFAGRDGIFSKLLRSTSVGANAEEVIRNVLAGDLAKVFSEGPGGLLGIVKNLLGVPNTVKAVADIAVGEGELLETAADALA